VTTLVARRRTILARAPRWLGLACRWRW
jgi:hypothetical protein